MKVLFVCWDGPQVAYLEGLFLPIFQCLAERGWHFHVLQFTWGSVERLKQSRQACIQVGIPYQSVRVWRRPVSLGALFTALAGARDIRRAIQAWNIDILMPRSTLPVLSCMRALRGKGLPLVFDADGLPLDERVDFGCVSPTGFAYRLLRDIEAQGLRKADAVMTRTERAADILLARAGAGTPIGRFHRVSNGRDSDLFAPIDLHERIQVRERLGIDSEAPLLVYAGSLGEQYCLPEMLSMFSAVLRRRPDARFLILTGSPEIARAGIADCPELEDNVIIDSVSPGEVPEYLAAADLGIALRRPTFSMQGVAPIKVGEYLLCGLPVVATAGVGDTSTISLEVGFLVPTPDADTFEKFAVWYTDKVLPERKVFRERCRTIGLEHYSLEASVKSYESALQSISK